MNDGRVSQNEALVWAGVAAFLPMSLSAQRARAACNCRTPRRENFPARRVRQGTVRRSSAYCRCAVCECGGADRRGNQSLDSKSHSARSDSPLCRTLSNASTRMRRRRLGPARNLKKRCIPASKSSKARSCCTNQVGRHNSLCNERKCTCSGPRLDSSIRPRRGTRVRCGHLQVAYGDTNPAKVLWGVGGQGESVTTGRMHSINCRPSS